MPRERETPEVEAVREAQVSVEAIHCQKHGAMMTQRPVSRQTPEQAFCGVWWDCTEAHERCTNSVLFTSAGLRAQITAMGGYADA